MRPRKADQIGTPCHQDRIDVIGLENIAHGHGFHTGIVANAVRHRRLEHAAIDGATFGAGLTCADVDDVGPGLGKGTGDVDGLFRGHAHVVPVGRRNPHGHRFAGGPDGAHGSEHFQRIAQPVFQRTAVVIVALVRQRRDEG